MDRAHGILLVGGGRSHQENYAEDFVADGRCRLVGVTDQAGVDERRARWNGELAASLKVPLLEDLDAALERTDVQVASVCVEFERRAGVAERCARAGKHVYLDKPVATTSEAAASLVAAVREAGVRSQMFSMVRRPWAERARQLVRSGALGDLVGLHCDVLFAKGKAGTADLGRPRQERFPPRRFTFLDAKRELFTTGVYSIGLLRWICGRRILRVFARTANYFFREHQKNDVEDFAAVTLEFEDGLAATVSGGRIGWQSHPSFGPLRLFLVGSRGTQLIEAARPRLEISCDAPPWRPPPPHPEDPMGFWSSTTRAMGGAEKYRWRLVEPRRPPGDGRTGSDASFFIDCIEDGRESDVNAAEGAEILGAMLAAYESAARGQPVAIR